MPYYLLTVESSRRSGFGLQVLPAVRVNELAARVRDTDVPVRGDTLILRFPDGKAWRAPLAEFAMESRMRDGKYFIRFPPSNPEFTLVLAGDRDPEDLPVGTTIWLDDTHPMGGHRATGWKAIIASLEGSPWAQVPPDNDAHAEPSGCRRH